MISLPSLLLCGVYCASLVAGDSSFTSPAELDDAGTWNPAQNQILKVGDFFDIAWTTTEEIVTLIINQDNSPSTQIDYLPNSRKSLFLHLRKAKVRIDIFFRGHNPKIIQLESHNRWQRWTINI